MNASDVIIFLTLLVLIWQTYLMRRQLNRSTIEGRYQYWLKVTELELSAPEFHRSLVPAKNLDLVKGLTNEELNHRAMIWLVFSVYAALYFETKPSSLELVLSKFKSIFTNKSFTTPHEQSKIDTIRALSNPAMRRGWVEWKLRDEWEESEFQEFIDHAINRYH